MSWPRSRSLSGCSCVSEPQLFEPLALDLHEALVGEVGEGRAAPERRRLPESRGRGRGVSGGASSASRIDELRAPDGIDVPWLDGEDVAAGPGLEPGGLGAEDLAQVRDVHPEASGGGLHRRGRPHLLDQPLGGDDLVGVEEQQRERRPLLAATEGHQPAVDAGLQRTEHPDVQRHEHPF
jgi:hypothetical protein